MKATKSILSLAGILAFVFALGLFGAQAADEKKEEPKKAEAKASDTAKGDMAPLPIALPKPLFIGTPKNIKSDNLEAGTGKPRGDFYAPKGCVNLASKKEVTASDSEPIQGKLDQLTDGSKEGTDGNYVEFAPKKQWVQIDLGQKSEIYAVVMWHFHSEARVYHDVIVQVSDDADFIKDVTTVFNNDHDNSSGLGIGKDKEYIETNDGKLADAKGVKGRYVRLYSNGSTSGDTNHMIEVEVWGKPIK
ncbi:MAG: discoidin domain-containing protein [Candidatus Sumerlaeota bacterium]|nr:discoidin domain-containing protein [Candidatus Sumerlaeota bacterium]